MFHFSGFIVKNHLLILQCTFHDIRKFQTSPKPIFHYAFYEKLVAKQKAAAFGDGGEDENEERMKDMIPEKQ